MNESTESALFAHHQFAGKIVFMVCIIPFLPCIIVSNALLVLAVYRHYSLRTPTNAIIVSLAISDLLDALVGIPLRVYATVFKFDASYFAEENTPYYALPLNALSGVSFCHIVALTADRFIAVTKPLRYASLVTFRRIAIVLGCLWLLSILPNTARSVISAHGSPTSQDEKERDCGARLTGTLNVNFTWFLFCLIVISMVALLTINALILHIAVKQARKIASQRVIIQFQQQQRPVLDDRLKAFKTISLVVTVFIIFWFPIPLYFILRLTTYLSPFTIMVYNHSFLVLHTISLVVNPIIYGFRDRAFRKAFQNIIRQF
ncbi:adenosine receptor A2b-like [Strongylocentrotus purpuratus]|uniref:G-protein coupled receptors family 1 profile domain-containing protein n=1 Tax=Strongylocentrotus purpuratus TaxID=7668 RepID=A0A7M7P3S2_STRPU|nr:adenosine receptor A2b-like [Strongylocentrotus purpuratus]